MKIKNEYTEPTIHIDDITDDYVVIAIAKGRCFLLQKTSHEYEWHEMISRVIPSYYLIVPCENIKSAIEGAMHEGIEIEVFEPGTYKEEHVFELIIRNLKE